MNNDVWSLLVVALPHFTRVPSDQTAWEGEAISFQCEADGTPPPVVFWTMEGSQVKLKITFFPTKYIFISKPGRVIVLYISQELVFPKSAHGTGSLYLDRVTTQHAGRLTCVAVSAAGSAMHTATLQVRLLLITSKSCLALSYLKLFIMIWSIVSF